MVSKLVGNELFRDAVTFPADASSNRCAQVVVIEILGHHNVVLTFVPEECDDHVELVNSLALLVGLSVGSLDLVILEGLPVGIVVSKLLVLFVFVLVVVEDQHDVTGLSRFRHNFVGIMACLLALVRVFFGVLLFHRKFDKYCIL